MIRHYFVLALMTLVGLGLGHLLPGGISFKFLVLIFGYCLALGIDKFDE